MVRLKTAITFFAVLALPTIGTAQVQTQRGAVVGGLSGAAIGAIIGDNNNEAGAGAAIGGVVGAVAGGILGNATDQEINRYPIQTYPAQEPPTLPPVPISRAVTTYDVIAMTRSNVNEHVIITEIQNKGLARKIDVPDIVQLSQQGVSNNVIRAMQTAGTTPVVVASAPVSRPVVVRPPPVRRVYHPPVYHRGPPVRYHHRSGRGRPGGGVSFSFGL